MKELLAALGAVLVIAYVIIQALLAVLQPLFNAFAGKLH
jgi:Flp pilus assembly pilin Flp